MGRRCFTAPHWSRGVSKLKIVIKYCGGCNPEFDRVEAVAEMLGRLADVVELVPLDDARAHMLLAVQGCSTACADLDQYKGKKIIVLSSQEAMEAFTAEHEKVRGAQH